MDGMNFYDTYGAYGRFDTAECEQAVLGAMLIDPDCIAPVMEQLRADDFAFTQNREIFTAISDMFIHGKAVDGLTVADELRKNGVSEEGVTRPYLAQLIQLTPTSANVMEYAAIVRDRAIRRDLAQTGEDITGIAREGTGTASEILEAAERKVYAIRNGRSSQGMTPMSLLLPGVLDELGEMSESDSHLRGLSTGFSAIDAKISGLCKSNLILIAARPGMGKTALAVNIALNVAKRGQTAAIFSLEMSGEQLTERMLSAEARVDNGHMKTGRLTDDDWDKIADAATVLNRIEILMDDNPMLTVADMNAKCRRLDNLGLVIIDYLQLIHSANRNGHGGENRQQIISEISRTLKIMAKDLNVPVVCLSQLSRACEKRDDKRPMLSDLRDSGAIEQDADIVMFLYRDDYYNAESDKRNITECIVAKNRHGETGKIELRWTPEYTLFSTLENRYESA